MYEVWEASNDVPNVVKIDQLVNMQGSTSHAHSMVSQLSFLKKGKLAQKFRPHGFLQ